jgi:hypothetical protein
VKNIIPDSIIQAQSKEKMTNSLLWLKDLNHIQLKWFAKIHSSDLSFQFQYQFVFLQSNEGDQLSGTQNLQRTKDNCNDVH